MIAKSETGATKERRGQQVRNREGIVTKPDTVPTKERRCEVKQRASTKERRCEMKQKASTKERREKQEKKKNF